MYKNNGIWEYIERNMKITVPKYMKSILMYCGYNNCHTISAFKQTDLNKIVTEVRQGNVTNFYSDLGIYDAEGSRESAENFEFILRHEKLLIAIINFVKQHLSDYGADIFLSDAPKVDNEHLIEVKLPKDVRTITPLKQDELHNDNFISSCDLKSHHNVRKVHEDIIKHQHTLLTMAVTSLSALTPKMYQENIETIAHRISSNLVQVVTLNTYDQPQYSAELICPYCFNVISVIYNATWITLPFDYHLTNQHEGDENRQGKNNKDLIPGFEGLNLNQNSLKHKKNGGQMTKGQPETGSVILVPKLGDYVLCSLKEYTVQWPSSVPAVKYYVGQVLSVKGTIEIKILQRKEYTKLTFNCLKNEDTRSVAQEEIIKILEIPLKNRRNHLVFKDKILLDI